MKTAKELNQAHAAREAAKVRPKQPEYNFEPLAQVIKNWIKL